MDPDFGGIQFSDSALARLEKDLQGGSEKLSTFDAEWYDGNSISWRLMRLAFVQLMQQEIDGLIKLLDLENECRFTYTGSLDALNTFVQSSS